MDYSLLVPFNISSGLKHNVAWKKTGQMVKG